MFRSCRGVTQRHPPGLKGILCSGVSSGAKGASRGGLGAAAPSPLSHVTPNTGFGAEEESPRAHPSPALPFTPCFSFAGSVPKARGEGRRGQPGHPGAAPEDGHCSWTQGPAAGHTDSGDSSSPWAVMERQGCERLSPQRPPPTPAPRPLLLGTAWAPQPPPREGGSSRS